MTDTQVVLATAATLARRLPIDRALVWSARMREAGFAANCPLVAIATGTASPEFRARAAATAVAAFADTRGREAFIAIFSSAQPLERDMIRAEAGALCPALLVEAERAAGPNDAAVAIELADPRVSIVIPCFNKAELTLGCLQSLQTTTDPALFEIILVDNGSDDATVNLSRAEGPRSADGAQRGEHRVRTGLQSRSGAWPGANMSCSSTTTRSCSPVGSNPWSPLSTTIPPWPPCNPSCSIPTGV